MGVRVRNSREEGRRTLEDRHDGMTSSKGNEVATREVAFDDVLQQSMGWK